MGLTLMRSLRAGPMLQSARQHLILSLLALKSFASQTPLTPVFFTFQTVTNILLHHMRLAGMEHHAQQAPSSILR